MSYSNPRHEGRLVLIPHVRDAFASLHVTENPRGSIESTLEGATSKVLHQVNEIGALSGSGDIYNCPFLFHNTGKPWFEANSYLRYLVEDKTLTNRPTDEIRRRASKLLDYLIFCEEEGLDWLDFSGRRPALRPTYKYFASLINGGKRSAAVINQYTGVVFNFYRFVSCNWHDIDMQRVDTVKEIKFLVKNSYGAAKMLSAEKRSQTKSKAPASSVSIGYVREDGEDLRPLSNTELAEFMGILKGKEWSALERVILLTALITGARKQTVLTMRIKHLKNFTPDKLQGDGTYLLHAGPGTGIDTKKDRSQRLHVPKQLAEELLVLANSSMMKERRAKLRVHLATEYPGFFMSDDDMYIFLSDQGGCYYMAKDDPRYPVVKSRPTGQVTDTIKRKLLQKVSHIFPKDFTYHWLRATFAFQLYQRLQEFIEAGIMQPGNDIDFIRERMHHVSREMTEHYLQLFKMLPKKLVAQEFYEAKLFFNSYADLGLDPQDG
ncbi:MULTISPECIES: site-specific integrase [Pseudomonas]|uniref:site-specific integrase n=1 Tax=Pseudomonas TaxID=286 RepID=UPI003F9E8724